MKVELLYIQVQKNIEDYTFLSESELEKINSIRNENIKQQTLHGKYLLHYFLSNTMNIKMPLMLEYNANGKPFYKNSNIQFSVSHCDSIVVVAFCSEAIGIDIENKVKLTPSVLNRLFNDYERQMIFENEKKFLDIFTAKEAVVKLFGLTLVPAFQRIKLINEVLYFDETQIPFIHFDLENTRSCIASKMPISNITMEEITLP